MLTIKFGFVNMDITILNKGNEKINVDKNFKCVPISCLEDTIARAEKRFVLLTEKALESKK